MNPVENGSHINIASHLPAMAEQQPDTLAVACPTSRDSRGETVYTEYSFRQLNEASDTLARGLEAIGTGRGTRTVLMVKPSPEFFSLTFAIFKVGALPVLVDPGMGVENLKQCLKEAEPEAFIGIPKAHAARKLLGWAKDTIRINVTVGRRLLWGGYTLDQVRRRGESGDAYEMAATSADDMAAILFTSGSTGVPKGAVYTHGNFAAQVEALKKLYDIQPGEIDLPTFPLFALFDPALGMSAIIPEMDATRPALVEPKNIIEPIRRFGVTNMFGSPALIRRVGFSREAGGTKLPSLKRVISAGAPVPSVVLEKFAEMLEPGAQIHTPYGATESLPVASIGSDEVLNETRAETDRGAGVCIGRPVEDIEAVVIRITDEPIESWSDDLLVETGEIGEIAVRGPMATRRYYNRDASTELAKIPVEGTDGFYHRMGDLGYLDERGRLWFCGRKAHRVQTSEELLFTVPCEAVFNTHEKVFRTALVGVGGDDERLPVLCVELESQQQSTDKAKVEQELLALGRAHPHTRDIQTVLFHPSFPVDIRHNSKIFREKLAVWAEGQLS